jgi:hypothetical protein
VLNAAPSLLDYCDQSNWFAQKSIQDAHPDVVVVAQELGHDPARMADTAQALKRAGVKLAVFIGPTPHWRRSLPSIVMHWLWPDVPRRTFRGVDDGLLQADRELKARFTTSESTEFVSITDFFCNASGCEVYLGEDRMAGITSYDTGHLTPVASDAFAKAVLVPLIVGQVP